MSTRGPSIAPRTVPRKSLAPSPAASAAASSPESASLSGPVTSIVTSKEWVLPPRSKPGRKPSLDTLVSKRKVQNRAAQRAFRERRATRVQQLEQQLLEVEKEKEIKEMGLISTINKLKFENLILSKSVEQLRQKFHPFRGSMNVLSAPASLASEPSPQSYSERYPVKSLPSIQNGYGCSTNLSAASDTTDAYKADLNQTAQYLLNFAKSLSANHTSVSPALLLYSIQQILPAPSADSPGSSSYRNPHQDRKSSLAIFEIEEMPLHAHGVNATDDYECGVCLKGECLCADIGLKNSASLEEDFSSFAPIPAVSLRGKRKDVTLEVDFTAEFSAKRMPDLKRLRKVSSKVESTSNPEPFDESSPVENCGFCSENTPCVCREAAKEASRIQELSLKQEQSLEEEINDTAEEAGSTLLPPIRAPHPFIMRKASLPVMHPGLTFELRDNPNMHTNNVPTVVSQELAEPQPLMPEAPNGEDGHKSGCTGNTGACTQ